LVELNTRGMAFFTEVKNSQPTKFDSSVEEIAAEVSRPVYTTEPKIESYEQNFVSYEQNFVSCEQNFV
jgi:hypothetical protein